MKGWRGKKQQQSQRPHFHILCVVGETAERHERFQLRGADPSALMSDYIATDVSVLPELTAGWLLCSSLSGVVGRAARQSAMGGTAAHLKFKVELLSHPLSCATWKKDRTGQNTKCKSRTKKGKKGMCSVILAVSRFSVWPDCHHSLISAWHRYQKLMGMLLVLHVLI